MTKFFIIIFLFISIVKVYSQPEPAWARRYDATVPSYVSDMCLDKSGNVYLAGHTGVQAESLLVVKYNTGGVQQWTRIYDDYRRESYPKICISVDDSGSVYLAATGNVFVNFAQQWRPASVLVKYSSSGDMIWNRKFMNLDSSYCITKGMVLDDSANAYVVSNAYVEGQNSNYLTLKYNKNGLLQWYRFYDNPYHSLDLPLAITKDPDNNIYVSGNYYQGATILVKYNLSGDSLWILRDSSASNALKIIVDKNFNIYTGGNVSTAFFGSSFILKKFDMNRNLLWKRDYNNPTVKRENNSFADFLIDKNNDAYITGMSTDTMELGWNYVTQKFNNNGDSSWTRKYNPSYNSGDEPSSIAVDKLGNCIVTGKSNNNLFNYKYTTIIYSPSGIQKYVLQYHGSGIGSHEAIKVLTDSSGNFYITGNSQSNMGVAGIATLKYSALTGIEQTSSAIPQNFELMQNYPNPFNPSTNIKYSLPKAGFVSIKVYDVVGRMIKELVSEFKDVGNYSVVFDGSAFASGIYFYRIETANFVDTKRMVLVK